ncbi:hypothetical protein M5K25_026865 [Dendrobium thyrsiflorum]|uniref:Uncharacterized protein n=1 Tax=Dendrobium thyrsiflorum TaxID=117978 RepID=A0ABD0TYJ1_DENTH
MWDRKIQKELTQNKKRQLSPSEMFCTDKRILSNVTEKIIIKHNNVDQLHEEQEIHDQGDHRINNSAVHSNHSQITLDFPLIYKPCHSIKSINKAPLSHEKGPKPKEEKQERDRRSLLPPRSSSATVQSSTTVFLTSVARRQCSFRPPSPADYGPYDLLRRLRSFRPPSPGNDNSPSDLRCQTTVLPTSVTHRQRSFQPSSPANCGLYDLLCRLRSFRPSSPDNNFSDLRRPPITIFPTSVAYQQRSLRPPLPTMVLPTSVARQRSFQPPSPDNGLSDLRRPPTTVFPTSVARRLRFLRPPLPTTVLLTSIARQRSF